MPETTTEPVTLGEAAQSYLTALKPADRQERTAEINRIIRSLGRDRRIADLRAYDVERYTNEQVNATDAKARTDVFRDFLSYLRKEGITSENLSVHVRLRRTTTGSATAETVTVGKIEVTAEGRAALEQELDGLRAQRPKIAEALRLAMADKDFRENAPLDAAREQQAHVEARIRELEAMLKRAVVVEVAGGGAVARMGSKVHLRDIESDNELAYTLVGPGEVNAAERRISIQSPVGKALDGRVAGDVVEVQAPSRTYRYRIESIDE